jgi:hypothetical protein
MTRASRLAFGFVMIAGAIVLVHNVLAYSHDHQAVRDGTAWHAWQVIVGTWLAASVTALPGLLIKDRGDHLRVASYVVPAVGIALLLPLTLHMPIALYLSDAAGFDMWCVFSGIFVGVAHVVFAITAGLRARALVEGREPIAVSTIYGVAVAMSCVPGLLVVLPPLVTAATGVPIIPLLFAMERWTKREREAAMLPTAILRAA